ncbi:hypothetical protein [Amycolatopsis anabasis]|uniref:hypothetical protein n=1 Tax=Amycolatopsis anabasis TaxID=1840409 RepID=UPI00131B1960|nr:hypothetical protein [Amycolatopsis anabasis]
MFKIISTTGARVVAALGVLFAVLLGGAAPAGAAESTVPARGSGSAAAAGSDGIAQAVIVGGFAFVLMVGAAAGVLWFTVRNRHHQPR